MPFGGAVLANGKAAAEAWTEAMAGRVAHGMEKLSRSTMGSQTDKGWIVWRKVLAQCESRIVVEWIGQKVKVGVGRVKNE